MSRPFDEDEQGGPGPEAPGNRDATRDKLIGLGERSMRKSYYPELRERMEQLERFRQLLDIASDLIFLVNADTTVIADLNRTACDKTGLAREQLLGSRLSSLLGERSFSTLTDLNNPQTPGGRGAAFISSLPQPGGGRFPVEVSVSVLGVGKQTMAVVVARDVTVRLRAQAELRHARDLLRTIVDAMPSTLLVVNGEGAVTMVNAHGAQLLGQHTTDIQGRQLGEVLPWLPDLGPALGQTLKDGQPRVLRKMPGKRGKEPAWYDATLFRLGDGAEAEAAARLDDVTSRVRLEEMLMQTEKMLSVGALAAGMAHEINNPLAGILQGVQSVTRRLSQELEPNRRSAERAGIDLAALKNYMEDRGVTELLESIQSSGVRASRIVSNILEFSRRSDASKAHVQLSCIVDKALELAVSEFDLQKKYDFRHIEIIRQDAQDLVSVWCVPTQIEQVVLNLLKNAAQSLAAAGTQNPTITVSTHSAEGMACIDVTDNGPGMDEATRERVFEPFFTTKAPGEGTGLGLSVVYYIVVEQHGGRVAVRSDSGVGTTVSVRLPFEPPQPSLGNAG
ncbi:PAS domain-containing sensor histidine kinase [Fundidesulfovibrio soli]|uniref:PAS domain-containing sensor histidine kinase n=1 Tax=Fundidesulfovibrio soli TaxID=2922716 RepID=UPI001FAFF70A|nr:ATP-binding protein [Fundidesulfovibrio soli]